MDHVLAGKDVVHLREDESAPVSRYTSQAVLDSEKQIIDAAGRMQKPDRHGVSARGIAEALDRNPLLDVQQRAALDHATRANGIAIIAGEAGTGKSTTLGAIRDAYKADGFKVIGMAPTHRVVQAMKRDGFDQATTIQAEVMRQASPRNRNPWNHRTVVMVDESAMVSTQQLGAILSTAEAAGAKVILCGDEPQLGSIQRGGMFGYLQRALGAAFLTNIYRVKDIEEQGAYNAMHRGDFRAALGTFDKRGGIQWAKTAEESRAALVQAWADQTAAEPNKRLFVVAHTNVEVNDLNQRMRAIRKERGELGEDHVLTTKDGPQTFAASDRVQFTGNATTQARKDAGFYNGSTGTIATIEDGRVTVALDGAKDAAPRVVSFTVGDNTEAGEYNAFRHNLASTVFKTQGDTGPKTLALHSDQWRSATSYVALSRHQETVTIFAAEKAAPWIMAEGGLAALTDKQRESAEKSYAGWAEAKPELATKFGFASYVGYVQSQWSDEKRLDPLDRLARQMGRIEERRAASEFLQGARPVAEEIKADEQRRKPPLSIVAGIVGDYLKLCYDPAKDWLQWVAEDLRYRAGARRSAVHTNEGRNHVHTEGAGAAVETGGGLRGDSLHPVQSGLDKKRGRGRKLDSLPARPGAGSTGNDELRPVRAERDVKPPRRVAAADYVRDRLARAEKEITKSDDQAPGRGNDPTKGRGRHRGRDR
jgi:hypothetical protein